MRVIEVLGSGCPKCRYLEKIVREAVDAAGIEADVRHVSDYAEIASRGVLSTPGLAIDGTVVVAGRIPTREQIVAWFDHV
ncbi:MAG: thioredoxin family protein [Chloroflexota bacterium]